MSEEINNFLKSIVNPFQLEGENPDSTILFNLTGENGGIYYADMEILWFSYAAVPDRASKHTTRN